jgi:hypothetical protein
MTEQQKSDLRLLLKQIMDEAETPECITLIIHALDYISEQPTIKTGETP